MDLQARPAIRHVDRVSISGKSLVLEADGCAYEITGVDPAVAFRFLSGCDGRSSTEEICRREGVALDLAAVVIAACGESGLLCRFLFPRRLWPGAPRQNTAFADWRKESFLPPWITAPWCGEFCGGSARPWS